ncbi:unnamed protein product, partial [Didymodactylos carnosus]
MSIWDYSEFDEILPGGVVRRTCRYDKTTSARVISGILTAGLSEINALNKNRIDTFAYYYANEHLGTTTDEAAATANRKAAESCNQGNFQEAQNLFNAAYYTCPSGHSDEQIFLNSKTATAFAVEGQNLLCVGKFSEAQAKLRAAYDHSTVSTIKNIFGNCHNATIPAIEGQNLLNAGKFPEAQVKFRAAYDQSMDTVAKSVFGNCNNAMVPAIEGQNLINAGKFSEAQVKFRAAYDQSTDTVAKNVFGNCNNAMIPVIEGQNLLTAGRFSEAQGKFRAAYDLST